MHIHILGIVGNKTAPLAIILTQQGNIVTGTDQEKTYPPFSTLLKKHHITINQTEITPNIDLVIVGNSYQYFEKCRQDFETIKKLKIPYISYTSYIVKNLIKKESILVAGSYGKTTISSLLAYIFTKLKMDPSYMFGGFSQDNLPSTHFGDSNFSIIESDENHNGLDTQPTFLYYPSKYLILTSANWEHKESFATAKENRQAYKKLIEKLPSDGLLIYNSQDQDIQKILPSCRSIKIPYSATQKIPTKLIGQHNQENIAAALTLCDYLKLDHQQVIQAISQFKGIKRRLEIVAQKNNILVIDDYAQSAFRVKSALEAIRYSYPHRQIFVYFEPHASFLQDKSSVTDFSTVFDHTTKVIIGQLTFSQKINKNNRTTAKIWISLDQSKILYLPLTTQIIDYFKNNLKPSDILVHFSSGGLEGLNTLNQIKKSILNIHL